MKRSVYDSINATALNFDINFWKYNTANELPLYPFCEEEVERILPRSFKSVSTYFMVVMLDYGKLNYTCMNHSILLGPGEVLLIPNNIEYGFESFSSGGEYKKYVLEIKGSMLDSILSGMNLNAISHFAVADQEAIIGSFIIIRDYLKKGNIADLPQVMAETYKLLYTLSLVKTAQIEYSPLLQQAMKLIDMSLDKVINLEEIVEKLGISRSTLHRLFCKEIGLSPGKYWILKKMESAKYYLKHTELSIKEIAYKLGYSSPFHFSKEFTKAYKLSPVNYKKNEGALL